MKAAPKPEGGGSPETAGTGGSGGTRRKEREGKGKRDISVGSQLVVTIHVAAHGHFQAIVPSERQAQAAPARWGVIWPVPSWLALNGPFDFPVRTGKMLAAERFCRPIEETMDAVANEIERIRRSHPRRIPSPPSQFQSLQSLPIPRHVYPSRTARPAE